jgi:hypothetical protein
MIDRDARKQAAEAIRHFVSGQITNDEFIRRYPSSKHDPVIWALDDTVWCLYDDIATHKLTGKFALTREFKKQVARWLMFLYSDQEYLWPRIGRPGFRSNSESPWLSWIFGFGQSRLKKFKASGDYEVWPFISREDFERARKKPVLLTGNI